MYSTKGRRERERERERGRERKREKEREREREREGRGHGNNVAGKLRTYVELKKIREPGDEARVVVAIASTLVSIPSATFGN